MRGSNDGSDLRLTREEHEAWCSYLRATAVISETLNRALVDETGLSLNEYQVLERLSEAPDHCMRMSQLADVMVHSRSRLTHTVARLERFGFVRRRVCEEDRRGVECTLTDEGYAKFLDSFPVHDRSVRRSLVDVLGHERMLDLGEMCADLISSQPRVIGWSS
ncbi:MAG: MarR family transcriptional regulator [Actinomycetaceae bacterium]|nr:MarR family transcriptional regulator [Actinomycetaceae bacterium]